MEFCPGCGKKSNGVCRDCRPNKEIKFKEVYIKVCATCRKYFYKNKWSPGNIERSLIKIGKESIKEKIKDIEVRLPEMIYKPGVKIEFSYEVKIDEDIGYIPGILEMTYCNVCSKHQGEYFEGILQLRDVDKNLLDFVDRYLKENNVSVSKRKELSNGIDMTISNKKRIQNLGHELQKKFGGTLKVNAQLFSRDNQTSKDIYRVNVYYQAPDYKLGDVLLVENKLVHISKITKTVNGFELKSGKNISVDLKGKEYSVLKPKKTRVSKVHPRLEVLDPETYQSVKLENRKEASINEKVEIVADNGLYYII